MAQGTDKKKAFDFTLLRRIFSFTRPYRSTLYLTMSLAIIIAVISPLRPFLIRLSVDKYIAGDLMQAYITAAVMKMATTTEGDEISCVRITPRRDFNILQVWNRDCQKFCKPEGLAIVDVRIPDGEVKYVPHVEKKI